VAGQAHITVFAAGILSAPLIAWMLLRRTGVRNLRRKEIAAALAAFVVSSILLTPPAVKNLGEFFRWRAESGEGFSFNNALIAAKTAVLGPVAFEGGSAGIGWLGMIAAVAGVCAALLSGRIKGRRLSPDSIIGCVVLVVASAVVSGSGGGDLYDYLMWWVGSLSIVCALTLLAQLRVSADFGAWCIAAAMTALLLVQSVYLSVSTVDCVRQLMAELPPTQQTVRQLAESAAEACHSWGTISFGHCGPSSWIPATGVALELIKRKCDVRLDDGTAFLLGINERNVVSTTTLTVATLDCELELHGELLMAHAGVELWLDSSDPWDDARLEMNGSPEEQAAISGFYPVEEEAQGESTIAFRWSNGRGARIVVPQHCAVSGAVDLRMRIAAFGPATDQLVLRTGGNEVVLPLSSEWNVREAHLEVVKETASEVYLEAPAARPSDVLSSTDSRELSFRIDWVEVPQCRADEGIALAAKSAVP
jgi:hypothetical protein